MPKHSQRRGRHSQGTVTTREKQRVVTEAARLLQQDPAMPLDLAKRKALQRLGLPDTFPLPRNSEIHSQLMTFHRALGEAPSNLLARSRQAALETAASAMALLAAFQPRLLGNLLEGRFYPDPRSILIRVTADTPEEISLFLEESGIPHALTNRRFRHGSKAELAAEIPCCQFMAGEQQLDILVLTPVQARQPLINPYTDSAYHLARPEELA